LVSLV